MEELTGEAAEVSEVPPPGVPLRNAAPLVAVARFFRNYARFSGRAGRSEFWWPAVLVLTAVAAVDPAVGTGPLFGMPEILSRGIESALLFPLLAATWRRLHDSNRSGSWITIAFIPVVGWCGLLVLLAAPPKPAGVKYDEPYLVLSPR